jgi:hypothetical protein
MGDVKRHRKRADSIEILAQCLPAELKSFDRWHYAPGGFSAAVAAWIEQETGRPVEQSKSVRVMNVAGLDAAGWYRHVLTQPTTPQENTMPSLLYRGTEVVTVFPAEPHTDRNGNIVTRPSAVGVVARAVVQPIPSIVPSEEESPVGFLTTSKYRLRLVGYSGLLGAQSQIEWQGRRYAIYGQPMQFNGSRRTAHVDYVIVRR